MLYSFEVFIVITMNKICSMDVCVRLVLKNTYFTTDKIKGGGDELYIIY